MTYNVFGRMLKLAESINHESFFVYMLLHNIPNFVIYWVEIWQPLIW